MPNLKFASLAILEVLIFIAQKFRVHVTLATLPSTCYVHTRRQRSVSTLPMKMYYVGVNLG